MQTATITFQPAPRTASNQGRTRMRTLDAESMRARRAEIELLSIWGRSSGEDREAIGRAVAVAAIANYADLLGEMKLRKETR